MARPTQRPTRVSQNITRSSGSIWQTPELQTPPPAIISRPTVRSVPHGIRATQTNDAIFQEDKH